MPSLDDFAGDWILERRIEHGDGTRARFAGTGSFSRCRGGLRYNEHGRLCLPGQPPLLSTRRLLWAGDTVVAVSFEDHRFFHRIDLRQGRPRARHVCGDDIYTGLYDFAAWPRWSVVWWVRGPRKSYRSATSHVPLAACATGAAGAEPEPEVARE